MGIEFVDELSSRLQVVMGIEFVDEVSSRLWLWVLCL